MVIIFIDPFTMFVDSIAIVMVDEVRIQISSIFKEGDSTIVKVP